MIFLSLESPNLTVTDPTFEDRSQATMPVAASPHPPHDSTGSLCRPLPHRTQLSGGTVATQGESAERSLISRPRAERCSYVLSRPFGFGFGQEVGDLFGEVLGAGAGQADGGDDASVASAEPDEPGSPWRLSPGAGGAGIDLNADGWHGCFPGFSGRCSGRFCWDADKTGTGRSVEGKLLLGHAASRQADGAGDGRRIVRRPAGAAADYRVRPSPGQVGVSGRRGGRGRSRGRRNA
jgi:hypothetical protein